MDRHHLTQSDLAQRSGITPSIVNRSLNDKTELSDHNYERLMQALTTDHVEQAEALACRLRDRCTGPGHELVKVVVEYQSVQDCHVSPEPAPETPVESAVRHLLEKARSNSDLRDVLLDLAHYTSWTGARIRQRRMK